MKFGDTVWQLIIGAIILAIIFMIVRPVPSGDVSPAAKAILDVQDSLAGLIRTATSYQAPGTGVQVT